MIFYCFLYVGKGLEFLTRLTFSYVKNIEIIMYLISKLSTKCKQQQRRFMIAGKYVVLWKSWHRHRFTVTAVILPEVIVQLKNPGINQTAQCHRHTACGSETSANPGPTRSSDKCMNNTNLVHNTLKEKLINSDLFFIHSNKSITHVSWTICKL